MRCAPHTAHLRLGLAVGALLAGAVLLASCGEDSGEDPISSRSYQGHASDADINAFVRAYPHTVGTRLDDCQTCHAAATVLDEDQEDVHANPCDYCHYILHPPDGWS